MDFIGGERIKEERKKAMKGFLHKKIKYLIATDIAARGLQFDDVDTVFHVNLPEDADTYLHRARDRKSRKSWKKLKHNN